MMMNYGYRVVVGVDRWYKTDSWNEAWGYIESHPIVDVYWNDKFLCNYTRKRTRPGSYPNFPTPFFESENSGEGYSVEYIYDNSESEKSLSLGSFKDAWDEITQMVKMYDNLSNWKIYDEDGELITQRSELFGQDSGGKTVPPKYRVVWRMDGTYVEFDNQDEAEAWGKENLTFFDIFYEPEVYVKTWKYDRGYDTWYSSYAPALIASKPKVEFSGHDFSDQLSGKENAVRNFRQLRSYIAANQAGEVDLLIAWEKLTQRLIQ